MCTHTDGSKKSRILYHYVKLDDGRTIQLFINRDTQLVVLDVLDTDRRGGNEVYRRNV